jgi:hypothetical protein
MTPEPTTNTGVFDIRRYGAVGDGVTADTCAVQRAIDEATRAGGTSGGVVLCPPGTYRIGSILLKDHVELHVARGATLLASPDRADYTAAHNAPLDKGFSYECTGAEHLICARNATDVAITGGGVIDGNGRAFMVPPLPGKAYFHVPGWRPGQLITFHKCTDVLVRDSRIVDSPYWTLWPHGCDRVRITGVSIHNNRRTPNGDGINPDCCRGMIISDCHIDAGDDCIAVRSDGCRLGEPHRPCEDIVVTNCTFITPTCGVRLGYCGDGPIRNCAFSNIVMSRTRTGINMIVPRIREPADGFVFEHGPAISGVTFNNIVMDTRVAIYLWVGEEAGPPAGIRDVQISNLIATTERACYIGGSRVIPIERVRLSNVALTVRGEMDDAMLHEVPDPYPVFDFWDRRGIPHGVYARHARGLEFHRVRIDWGDVTGPWRSAMRFERVEDLCLDGVSARPAPGSDRPAIELSQTRGVTRRGFEPEAFTPH